MISKVLAGEFAALDLELFFNFEFAWYFAFGN